MPQGCCVFYLEVLKKCLPKCSHCLKGWCKINARQYNAQSQDYLHNTRLIVMILFKVQWHYQGGNAGLASILTLNVTYVEKLTKLKHRQNTEVASVEG